jgi:hypothetical protein
VMVGAGEERARLVAAPALVGELSEAAQALAEAAQASAEASRWVGGALVARLTQVKLVMVG